MMQTIEENRYSVNEEGRRPLLTGAQGAGFAGCKPRCGGERAPNSLVSADWKEVSDDSQAPPDVSFRGPRFPVLQVHYKTYRPLNL
jgi:hypothetical protein